MAENDGQRKSKEPKELMTRNAARILRWSFLVQLIPLVIMLVVAILYVVISNFQ